MMQKNILTPLLLASSLCSAASDISYVCIHNSQQRTIDVVYTDEGPVPCEVQYSKDTGTTTLWRAEGQ